jgi:putative NIF3 family GTP cyclohydrolase 1 type 2
VKTKDIVAILETDFDVSAFDESREWNLYWRSLPEHYGGAYKKHATSEFLTRYNGLAFDSAEDVNKVYLIVFPSEKILTEIVERERERGGHGALIFSHHLVDVGSEGFSLIPEWLLRSLAENRISFYCMHAPLDCNERISTSGAVAEALGLSKKKRFAPFASGLSGVYGQVMPTRFNEFTDRLKATLEIDQYQLDQLRNLGHAVEKVAIVAGECAASDLKEAQELGCDTLVTGIWWITYKEQWAEAAREELAAILPEIHMNLIGGSHYATEMVVLRDRMTKYFEALGLEVELVRQDDPWR